MEKARTEYFHFLNFSYNELSQRQQENKIDDWSRSLFMVRLDKFSGVCARMLRALFLRC